LGAIWADLPDKGSPSLNEQRRSQLGGREANWKRRRRRRRRQRLLLLLLLLVNAPSSRSSLVVPRFANHKNKFPAEIPAAGATRDKRKITKNNHTHKKSEAAFAFSGGERGNNLNDREWMEINKRRYLNELSMLICG
jgi:hypothetical protein